MLVKCRCCGKKIDRVTAFKTVKYGKNEYYCNNEEYINKLYAQGENRRKRDAVSNLITEIFGYEITNTILYKEWTEWNKNYDDELIYHYLQDNVDYLSTCMTKDFSSEYGKIRYFSAILKNNLQDYKNSRKEEINREYIVEDFNSTYKPKKKRKPMEEFEDEVDDE